jgi:hypothetical protein
MRLVSAVKETHMEDKHEMRCARLLLLEALAHIKKGIELGEFHDEDFAIEERLTNLTEDLGFEITGEKPGWWLLSRVRDGKKEFDIEFCADNDVLYGRESWSIEAGPFRTWEEADEAAPAGEYDNE